MRLNNSLKAVEFLMVAMLTLAVPGARAQFSDPASAHLSATTVPKADLIQPADLAKMLKAGGSARPTLFQVGSSIMFQQAHIPNSAFAGPGSQTSGLILLQKLSTPLHKNQLIVIYCGCCPWGRCPNIGPAYKKLRDLGFTNVKALYLANNFGDDWLAKGYPVEKGQ